MMTTQPAPPHEAHRNSSLGGHTNTTTSNTSHGNDRSNTSPDHAGHATAPRDARAPTPSSSSSTPNGGGGGSAGACLVGGTACAYCRAAHTCVPCPTQLQAQLTPFCGRFAAFFRGRTPSAAELVALQHDLAARAGGRDNDEAAAAAAGPPLHAGIHRAWQAAVGRVCVDVAGGEEDWAVAKLWHSMYLPERRAE